MNWDTALHNISSLSHHTMILPIPHKRLHQWEFQDPKIELLYHISGHIFWGYSFT